MKHLIVDRKIFDNHIVLKYGESMKHTTQNMTPEEIVLFLKMEDIIFDSEDIEFDYIILQNDESNPKNTKYYYKNYYYKEQISQIISSEPIP